MEAERIELMPAPVASTDCRVMLRAAAGIIVFTFVVLGGWSAVAHIDSAVVADGAIAVESNRKTVQHLEGGIVREILVRDGDVVHQGDTLIRLDPTRDAATDKGFRQQLAIASAPQARLMAQRDMHGQDGVSAGGDGVHGRSADRQCDPRQPEPVRSIGAKACCAAAEVIEKQIAQAKDEIRQADGR